MDSRYALPVDTVVDGAYRIERVVGSERIDCDFAKGGYLSVARNPAQWTRAQAEVAEARRWGLGEDTLALVSRPDAERRFGARDVLGGTYASHCAAIHPAKLVRGLARTVERRGVAIYEQTPMSALVAGGVVTPRGVVQANTIILATEAKPRQTTTSGGVNDACNWRTRSSNTCRSCQSPSRS